MPPVFSDLAFEEAKVRAANENKLLIVDGTAEWCGPCKQMDRTTWVNEKVVEWIEQHALAIQVDVDHQPDVAEELRIRAMPTIIAFKGNDEVDRFLGYRDADETLKWMTRVASGESEADHLRKLAGERADENGEVDIHARMDLARQLQERGLMDEALDELEWLWDHMVDFDPAMIGVRGSFLAKSMEELAADHPPAKVRFTGRRDALAERLRAGEANRRDLEDWIVLCEVIGDEQSIIDWVDRVQDQPNGLNTLRRLEYRLLNLLVAHDRWKIAGRIVNDPMTRALRDLAISDMSRSMIPETPGVSEEQQRLVKQEMLRYVFQNVCMHHALAMVNGQHDVAMRIANELLERDDSAWTRVQLVTMATEAGAALPQHLLWLDEAAANGADVAELRERIKAILDADAAPNSTR